MKEPDRNGFWACPQGQERAYMDFVIKAAVIEQMCTGTNVEEINEAIWDLMPAHEVSPQEFTLWLLAFEEIQGCVND